MKDGVYNATIEGTTIGDDDHGGLTSMVFLDYGDSGHQGFGGYRLHAPSRKDSIKELNVCGVWVWRVMEIAGVCEWSELCGKNVRAVIKDEMIVGIGHITKDLWFYPKEVFAEMKTC